ncbi:MAG TPA: type II toxin-antitoxin system VapC family toxin [Terracidiphilus sp.]|nr:type II toxin-antitoxin system VapC family toxin [Terracidiphilus sp.]
MTGLDTNVLLRFFAQDDQRQSPLADATMASLTIENPGWVGLATVLEFVWAMSKKMRLAKAVVCDALDRLLMLETIVVEHDATVASAVQRFRSTRADFADCLIAISAQAAGCTKTLTFDEIAARDAGMELIN